MRPTSVGTETGFTIVEIDLIASLCQNWDATFFLEFS